MLNGLRRWKMDGLRGSILLNLWKGNGKNTTSTITLILVGIYIYLNGEH